MSSVKYQPQKFAERDFDEVFCQQKSNKQYNLKIICQMKLKFWHYAALVDFIL